MPIFGLMTLILVSFMIFLWFNDYLDFIVARMVNFSTVYSNLPSGRFFAN
jgi:hypothetical protein